MSMLRSLSQQSEMRPPFLPGESSAILPQVSPDALPKPGPLASNWRLDPRVVFLNHGSFGACPTEVLRAQARLRDALEAEPVRFLVEMRQGLMDDARGSIGHFVDSDPLDIVPVPNATHGVAIAFASQTFAAGDEILVSTHEYPACIIGLRHLAARTGAVVVMVDVPFPIRSPQDVVDAYLARVTPRTKAALFSHVTSPTGIILPVRELARELEPRGICCVVDGAHAIGMLPDLNIAAINASFYTANCHKWVCSPKGSAFLWVRPDRQKDCRPLVLSNSAETPRPDRKHLLTEFDYVGTSDPSAFMSIPEAIVTMNAMVPGGWPEVMKRNHELALRGRDEICRVLEVEPPAPDSMLGSMATVLLPPHEPNLQRRLSQRPTKYHDALWDELIARHGIQVPIWCTPGWSPDAPARTFAGRAANWGRTVRLSAQLYNSVEQYQYLAHALKSELERERTL